MLGFCFRNRQGSTVGISIKRFASLMATKQQSTSSQQTHSGLGNPAMTRWQDCNLEAKIIPIDRGTPDLEGRPCLFYPACAGCHQRPLSRSRASQSDPCRPEPRRPPMCGRGSADARLRSRATRRAFEAVGSMALLISWIVHRSTAPVIRRDRCALTTRARTSTKTSSRRCSSRCGLDVVV